MASSVYLSNGTPEEALRVAKEARTLCQTEKEKRGEAEALQNVAGILVDQVQQNVERAKTSKEETMKEALDVTRELVELCCLLLDEPGQVSALLNLSNLYSLNKDGEKAVDAAEEALEIAAKLNDPQEVGSTLLQLAEAYLNLGKGPEAESRAIEAKGIFESMGHDIGIDAAVQLIEDAKNPPPPPEPDQKPGSSSGGPAAGNEKGTFPVNAAGLKKLDGKGGTDTKKAAPQGARPARAAPKPSAPGEQELLRAGNFAILQGLKARPDLNGSWGLLVKYHEGKQRWQVRLEGAEDMMVRIENIQAKSFEEYEADFLKDPKRSGELNPPGGKGGGDDMAEAQEAFMSKGKGKGKGGAAEDQGKRPRGGRQLFSQMSKALDEQEGGKGGKAANTRGVFSNQASSLGGDDSEVEDVLPSAPDQELRRQQLNAAMNQPTVPNFNFGPSSKEIPLKNVLRAVRPDWSNSELYAVQAKLRKIQIEDPEQLFHLLRTQGEKKINAMLKAVGEKGMKMDTLEALHNYGDKME